VSLDKTRARDERIRDALADYSRGKISETTCRDILRFCGMSQSGIDRLITAKKDNIL